MNRHDSRLFALIRHGDYHQLVDTPSAHQPFPLTAQGRRQAAACAEQIAELLRSRQWQLAPVIDSSNLLRAWQTASLIADHLRTLGAARPAVEGFDALAERSLGIAGNLTLAQVADVVGLDPRTDPMPPDWKSNSRYRLPVMGAESLIDAGRRVARHIAKRLIADEADQPALKLFVGHGAAFRHAAYDLGLLAFDDLARLSMYHAEPIVFRAEGGQWQRIEGGWKVRTREAAPD